MWGMRRIPGLVLGLCILGSMPVALEAQRPLMRGSRIRVWTEGAPIVGALQARTDTSLALVPDGIGDTVTVPYRMIAGLEMSRGKHVRLWPMVIGILAGSVIGGVADGSINSDTAGLGAIAGLAAGALIGSRFKADSWRPINVPMPPATPVAVAPQSPASPSAGEPARSAPTPQPAYAPPPAVVPGYPQAGGFDLGPTPGEFAPGARIRYMTSDMRGLPRYGRLLRVEGDTMVVQPTAVVGMQRVALPTVTRLEVSEGWGRNTVKGLLIGALIGSAVYSVAAMDWVDGSGQADDVLALGIFLGAPIGGGIGAAAGALTRSEHWRRVEQLDAGMPVTVGLNRVRGRVRISLAFRP